MKRKVTTTIQNPCAAIESVGRISWSIECNKEKWTFIKVSNAIDEEGKEPDRAAANMIAPDPRLID